MGENKRGYRDKGIGAWNRRESVEDKRHGRKLHVKRKADGRETGTERPTGSDVSAKFRRSDETSERNKVREARPRERVHPARKDARSDVEQPKMRERNKSTGSRYSKSTVPGANAGRKNPEGKASGKRKRKLYGEQPAGGRGERKPRLSFSDERRGGIRGIAAVLSTGKYAYREREESDQENAALEGMEKAGAAGKQAVRYAIHVKNRQRGKESPSRSEKKTDAVKTRLRFEATGNEEKEAVKHDGAVGEKKSAVDRLWRKRRQRQSYHTAARKDDAAVRTAQGFTEKIKMAATDFAKKRDGFLLTAGIFFLLSVSLIVLFSSCGVMLQGGGASIVGTTYPSRDEDIYAVEADYTALETVLDAQINNMESTYPGYDEYRYQVDEISHNPYQMISFLTTQYEEFTYTQVASLLPQLFEEQYRLTLEEVVEIRTRTETHTNTNPLTGEEYEEEVEVEYEYHILCISLDNKGFDTVARNRLTAEQVEHYVAYNTTYGNRDYLFPTEGLPTGEGFGYEIPQDALSDERFAAMVEEAEKYLGMTYVWGGSTPATGFDCSGFVSWVVNNCGNGWNVGRQTAEGLRSCCAYVSPTEAKPGDLIFFQGTYETPGASHVGIYVGNNMMIHCGNPIQYASIGPYWQGHFLAFGRIQ